MRLHLFEWMDQPWLPAPLRDAMRRYLSAAYRATPFPRAWAEQLAATLRETKSSAIVDLGSGAAGPVQLVAEELLRLGAQPSVTLTDLYPMPSAAADRADWRYWPAPVDARAVPAHLPGARTMFAAFHHLRPAEAREVLRDAFTQRQPICIFEATARTPGAVLLSLLIPILVLVMTPSIRPRSALQLIFTYLVPILPVLIFWDGLVSNLRTYSPEELADLTRGLAAPDYGWRSGTVTAPGVPMAAPFLIGHPAIGHPTERPAAVGAVDWEPQGALGSPPGAAPVPQAGHR